MADARSILYQHSQATNSGISTAATALAANDVGSGNTGRGAWMIQNLGTNTLYVKMGTGASVTDFNVILKASSVQDDGSGGVISQEAGTIYTGIITVAGTSPRYVATEM